MIVEFGIVCDLCGAGSRNYANDCSACEDCMLDLCSRCEATTRHVLYREADEGHGRKLSCDEVSQ